MQEIDKRNEAARVTFFSEYSRTVNQLHNIHHAATRRESEAQVTERFVDVTNTFEDRPERLIPSVYIPAVPNGTIDYLSIPAGFSQTHYNAVYIVDTGEIYRVAHATGDYSPEQQQFQTLGKDSENLDELRRQSDTRRAETEGDADGRTKPRDVALTLSGGEISVSIGKPAIDTRLMVAEAEHIIAHLLQRTGEYDLNQPEYDALEAYQEAVAIYTEGLEKEASVSVSFFEQNLKRMYEALERSMRASEMKEVYDIGAASRNEYLPQRGQPALSVPANAYRYKYTPKAGEIQIIPVVTELPTFFTNLRKPKSKELLTHGAKPPAMGHIAHIPIALEILKARVPESWTKQRE